MVSFLSEEYLINATITRIVAFSIASIGCLIVLYYELKHRQSISEKNKKKQRWLLVWSMSTILCSTMSNLLFVVYALPTVCLYTTHLAVFTWGHKLVFLGLFQIRRLQLLFREDHDQDHVKLERLFKALYCGAFLPVLCCILMMMAMTVEDHGEYGCIWTYQQFGYVVNWMWIFLYLCWDGTTLIVYILKLLQYRKSIQKTMNNPENRILPHTKALYNNIKSALSKVILLTLVYEVTSTIVALLTNILNLTHNEYLVIVYYAVSSVDIFASGFVVYLMQNHNKKHYHAFLLVLNKLHLTLCCKTLAHDANEQLNGNTTEKTATPTGSTGIVPPSIQKKQVLIGSISSSPNPPSSPANPGRVQNDLT
eukprot:20176_1